MLRGASYTFAAYRRLPAVTSSYRRLPAVTGGYRRLLAVTGGYRRFWQPPNKDFEQNGRSQQQIKDV
eukprot:2164578-Heterocapsa_arctica.AAC.1